MFYVVTARLYVITDTKGTIFISFYRYDYKQFCFTFYNILNIFILKQQLFKFKKKRKKKKSVAKVLSTNNLYSLSFCLS